MIKFSHLLYKLCKCIFVSLLVEWVVVLNWCVAASFAFHVCVNDLCPYVSALSVMYVYFVSKVANTC